MNGRFKTRGWLITHITVCLLALSSAASGNAAILMDIQPRVIRLNETATLTLSFVNVDSGQPPDLNSLRDFQAQFIGKEQKFEFVNGNSKKTANFRYRLVPNRAGTFTIGPFTIALGNQTFDIQPVSIEVLPASAKAPGQQSESINDLVFARLHTSRDVIYNQESFDIFIDLYHRGVNLDRNVSLADMPTTGLAVENYQEIRAGRETVNGEIYDIRHFRARATALTAGAFTFAPSLQVKVLVQRNRRQSPFGLSSPFEDMFFGRYDAHPLTVKADPFTLTVKPIPEEGRPDTYGGAVGRYSLDVDITPKALKAGEPITLTVHIRGAGNIDTVSMPVIRAGDEFKVYDARQIDRKVDPANNMGVKSFEQVFIPRSEQVTEIPPILFSYFDPEKSAYETLVSGPHAITVEPSGQPQSLRVDSGGLIEQTREIQSLGVDIVYLKPAPKTWKANASLVPEFSFVNTGLAVGLPLFAVAAVFLVARRRESLETNVALSRRVQAPRAARKALADASSAADDPAEAYACLWRAISDYIANRKNVDAGSLSPSGIEALLEGSGIKDTHREAIRKALSMGEQVRFGGVGEHSPDAVRAHIASVTAALKALEKKPL